MEEPAAVCRPVGGGTAKLLPDVDRRRAWMLTVDGAPQSYVDLDDPLHLEFEYVRRLAHVLDLAGPEGAPLDVLHLGGGGLTLPRYAAHTRPGSRQRVVESDAELSALVAEFLPLPAGAGTAVEAADARAALESSPPASADVVVADVFGGNRVPPQMTTVGCARAAARALRPGGIYAANLADAAPFGFLGSQIATWRAAFTRVCVVAEPAVLRGRRFGNVLLLASDGELPPPLLARRTAADPFPARVVPGAELEALRGGAIPVQEDAAAPSPVPPEGSFGIG
ncbi:spermidine synthase-like protein [Streptomyces sp. RKND-216]|uniref:spermidine synthase n=1 Tax=Streptomyces sp. RKND-216 TaxID=2562581 RepID=UPI00109DC977|nr:fused MFS/spermidine synthase [Streptomyces sp. RKND-216]THA23422.1 spermidine synthase-like protein [Streptomyces sp. RKND-216]